LNKKVKELMSEKKELEMNIGNYKSKRSGVDQQLKDAIQENFTLRVILHKTSLLNVNDD